MEQQVSTCFEATPQFAAFLQDNLIHLELLLKELNCHFATFPGDFVKISHPPGITADYLQLYLLEHYSNLEFQRILDFHEAGLEGKSTRTINLTSTQNVIVRHYQDWISAHTELAGLVFNPDRSISLFGEFEAVQKATLAINTILCHYSLGFNSPAKQHQIDIYDLPSRFAASDEPKYVPHRKNFSEEEENATGYEKNSDGISSLLQEKPTTFINLQTSSPEPAVRGMFQELGASRLQMPLSASNSPLFASKPYMFTENLSSHGNRPPLSPASLPASPVDSVHSGLPMDTPSAKQGEMRSRLMFMVKSCEAPRLIGSRGANKKKLEQITGCHLMFHTENRREGQFPIEISGTSDDVVRDAKQTIVAYLDSEATAPGHDSPSKTRSPAKIMLQLSPKKRAETEK